MNQGKSGRTLSALFIIICLSLQAAWGQQPGTISSPPPPSISISPAYQGSVAEGTASSTPVQLTLTDAIARGLRTNLGLLTSEQVSRQSRADRYRALSALLPSVTGSLSENVQQTNLDALGLKFPSIPGFSIPHIIGPFAYSDIRAQANVPILNFTSIQNYRSSKERFRASELSLKDAHDLVVQAVGASYLQIIAGQARVEATKADVDTALVLYDRAVNQNNAGVAPRIDVLRAQVELKRQQQLLVAQQNQLEKDKLTLARVIGLPANQGFTVSDPTPPIPLENVSLEETLGKAYANRADFQAAQAQLRGAELSKRAAQAQRYPTLGASGDYGVLGQTLGQSHGTFAFVGALKFNIFDGKRITGDVLEADSQLRQRKNEVEDLRGKIDYEVRSALLDLKSSSEQVAVARSNVDLAKQTLVQARDRFSAGVTDNIEVVQAQQALAGANENLIASLYANNIAKVSLARATGLAEEGIRQYFAKP